MEKLSLKTWQKLFVYSIIGLLFLLVIISILLDKKSSQKKSIPIYVNMDLDIVPNNKTDRLFEEEKAKGDSLRFELIEGMDKGWIIQSFLVGQQLDYNLVFDFRQSDHKWKKDDSLVFIGNIPDLVPISPIGIMQFYLQSNLRINTNHFLTDKIDFSHYYLALKCLKYDSLASFKGVFYAENYLKNPDYTKDKLFIRGEFFAEQIPISKRYVN